MKRQHPGLVTDHALFRSLNGIIAGAPEDLESTEELFRFVYAELLQEYSAFLPTNTVEAQLHQVERFAQVTSEDAEEDIFFFSQPQGSASEALPVVQVKTMADTIKKLVHAYAPIRGKSYNDRLVFSPHFSRQVVSMMRAFSRSGTLGKPNFLKIPVS